MNTKLLMALAMFGLIAYAVWRYLPPLVDNAPAPASATAATTAATGDNTVATTSGRLATTAAPVIPRNYTVSTRYRPKLSATALEFQRAKNLKPFYEKYLANPNAADPETYYFAALVAEECDVQKFWATGQERSDGSQATAPLSAEEKLANFTRNLKPNNPNNARRIEAFNATNQRCAGFESLNITLEDINKLYAAAAAGGHPAAQVKEMTDTMFARSQEERKLSENELTQLRSALQSGDPNAIQNAGLLMLISIPWDTEMDGRARMVGWLLAACDAGANCGADSKQVLWACAMLSQCGYQNLESYKQFNNLSPNSYIAAQQIRDNINAAIQNGDWGRIGIAAGTGRTVPISPPPEGVGRGSRGGRGDMTAGSATATANGAGAGTASGAGSGIK